MKPIYQTKEFWKQVKKEYASSQAPEGFICFRSKTFEDEWQKSRSALQDLGIGWLAKSRKYRTISSTVRPSSILFYCKCAVEQSRPVFINAMIKKFS